jgi:hypothetical protein
MRRDGVPALDRARGGTLSASGARYFIRRAPIVTDLGSDLRVRWLASLSARSRLRFIQDSASRIMGNAHSSTRQHASFERKGDLHPGRVGLNSPNTDL